jgi:hypothetical protein
MRIVAVITEPAVITRILAHRVRARDPTPRLRGPPPRRRRALTPTGATPPSPSLVVPGPPNPLLPSAKEKEIPIPNQSQLAYHLTFTRPAGTTTTLSAKAPASGNLVPPGPYMLFIINGSGVPSMARMVTVGP